VLDKQKLVKVLNLTRSSSDGEALSAIRKANSMLDKEGCLWDKVLSQSEFGFNRSASEPKNKTSWEDELADLIRRAEQAKKKAEQPKYSYNVYSSTDIEKMLKVCLRDVDGAPRAFIQSLKEHWEEFGTLTGRQADALNKFYVNCQNRRNRG
jgi:hypothetical protein